MTADKLRVETIADGLAYPWSLAFLPDGNDALITERPGRIRRLSARGLSAPLPGVPRVTNLLDVAPAADFARTSQLYFSLVREENGNHVLEVWKARLGESVLVGPRRVYRARTFTEAPPLLNAGRLLILAPGELVVSIADQSDLRPHAQDSMCDSGKLVRLVEGAGQRIVARGLRNVQGLAIDRQGTIWFTDHGPRGGDELNVLQVGGNYGWPLVSFGQQYNGAPIGLGMPADPRFVAPLAHWTPAIAPSSLMSYAGAEFPEWQGSIFVGSLAQRHLRRLEIHEGEVKSEEILLGELGERIRDVRADRQGRIYVLTDNLKGRVLRISALRDGEARLGKKRSRSPEQRS